MTLHCTCKFFPYKRRGYQQHGAALRMRLTLRGQPPIDISTGYVIPLDQWDGTTQTVRATYHDSDTINNTLQQWRAALSETIARYTLIEHRTPTRGELRDLFRDIIGKATPLTRHLDRATPRTLYDCFDTFTATVGHKNLWTRATYQKFHTLRQHLYNYDPLLAFATLSEKKLQGYVDHLLAHNMRNTTIAKSVSFLRWFLRWAYNNDYYTGHLHDTFKPRLKGTSGDHEIIYLTLQELSLLRDHTFTPEQSALDRVRDVFLFCCYSGLRYSDAAHLRRCDIHDDYISIVTKKTSDPLHIELNKYTRAILAKYRDCPLRDDHALPTIANTNMNLHLKTIGNLCHLDTPTRVVTFYGNHREEHIYPKWQLLTTHVARRTFVVTALQLGIAADVIMRWTGHSRYDAMKPYIAIVDDLKRTSMSKFDSI